MPHCPFHVSFDERLGGVYDFAFVFRSDGFQPSQCAVLRRLEANSVRHSVFGVFGFWILACFHHWRRSIGVQELDSDRLFSQVRDPYWWRINIFSEPRSGNRGLEERQDRPMPGELLIFRCVPPARLHQPCR